jgi:hypothetical protein
MIVFLLCRDFILLPDTKWDGTTPELLYLQALSVDSSLKTLRDLSRKHIPSYELSCFDNELFLFLIANNAIVIRLLAVKEMAVKHAATFGITSSQLRCFFHYLPVIKQKNIINYIENIINVYVF